MTLIVETGAGLANANTYAGLTATNTYHADRGRTAWAAATNSAREAALIVSTDFLDAFFVFRSVPLTDDQALQNPRYGDEALNPAVVKACMELALIALGTDLFAIPDAREIVAETKSVGPLTKSVTYSASRSYDRFPAITAILRGIATRRTASGGTVWLSR